MTTAIKRKAMDQTMPELTSFTSDSISLVQFT